VLHALPSIRLQQANAFRAFSAYREGGASASGEEHGDGQEG
jgi:hypothetical protein